MSKRPQTDNRDQAGNLRKRCWFAAPAVVSVFLAGLVMLAPAAVADDGLRRGPGGLAFYSPPHKLVPGHHGTVIWVRRLHTDATLPAARKNLIVLYRSRSPSGKTVPVSGTLAIPKGTPPHRGWPVIAWDHGSTGIADHCAPSHNGRANFENRRHVLDKFLRKGYAVVQTDYQGLGTPGLHPFVIGRSEGRSVVDMVLAARELRHTVGQRWLPIGVSQGGHASLWAAGVSRRWAPRLDNVGVVALAPATGLRVLFEVARNLSVPVPLAAAGGLAMVGAKAAGFHPRSVLTKVGISLLPDVYSRCLPGLQRSDSWGGVPPRDLLRSDADLGPLYRIFDANDAATLSLRVPVFIGIGTADSAFPPALVRPLVDQLRSNGAKVKYRTYEGIEHGGPEMLAAYSDYARFIAARFRGSR